MQLRSRRWHATDAPFFDVETTPYADGTVNVRLIRIDAKRGDTREIAREQRMRHVHWENDVPDNDIEIMRNVRACLSAARLMATHTRTPKPVQSAMVLSIGPSKRKAR